MCQDSDSDIVWILSIAAVGVAITISIIAIVTILKIVAIQKVVLGSEAVRVEKLRKIVQSRRSS